MSVSTRPRRPVMLLVNPVAGGKPAAGAPLSDDPRRLEPEALAAALRDRGLEVQLRVLAAVDDVGEIAAAGAERHDIVVAGGDGTVGPAGIAVVGTDAALGILPLGSFNNVAHGLGLPDRLDSAIAAIAAGRVAAVDVGVAEREGTAAEPFLEAGGVGLDAMGFGAVSLADRRGLWSALRFVWRALRRRPIGIELTLDGRVIVVDAPTVVVCNGPYHGAGFALAPDADPSDGRLDVAIFERMSRLGTIRHYLRVARGRRVRDPRLRIERAAEIAISSRGGALAVQVDGRAIGATPIAFRVRHAALRVFR